MVAVAVGPVAVALLGGLRSERAGSKQVESDSEHDPRGRHHEKAVAGRIGAVGSGKPSILEKKKLKSH